MSPSRRRRTPREPKRTTWRHALEASQTLSADAIRVGLRADSDGGVFRSEVPATLRALAELEADGWITVQPDGFVVREYWAKAHPIYEERKRARNVDANR